MPANGEAIRTFFFFPKRSPSLDRIIFASSRVPLAKNNIAGFRGGDAVHETWPSAGKVVACAHSVPTLKLPAELAAFPASSNRRKSRFTEQLLHLIT
jgi:hypothetical protein